MRRALSWKLCVLLFISALTLPGATAISLALEKCEIERTDDYTVYRLTYPSPGKFTFKEGRTAVSYLYVPVHHAAEGKVPAALCLHILGGNGDVSRMTASYLAKQGILSMVPIMPMFLERTPPGGRVGSLQSSNGSRYLGEAFTAIPQELKLAVDILASQPGVDSTNINLIGTSMGGILAVSAAARDVRINKAVFLLAGGNLRTIIALDRHEVLPFASAIKNATTAELKVLEAAFDAIEPMNYAEKLRKKAEQGQILMINAGADEVIPQECTRRLAEAMGLKTGQGFILMPGLGHYTGIAAMPKVLKDVAEFFGAAPETKKLQRNDADSIRKFFAELNKLLKCQPAADKSFRLAAQFKSTNNGKLLYSGNVSLFVAGNDRFKLELKDCRGLEDVDSLSMGRGFAPWVISQGGTLFIGKEPGADDFSSRFSSKISLYRMPALMLTSMIAASGSMEAFEKFVKLEYVTDNDGNGKILAAAQNFRLEVKLEPKNNTPTRILVKAGKNETKIDFTEWNLDSDLNMQDFEPPVIEKKYEVASELLDQVFAAVFNFAIGKIGQL